MRRERRARRLAVAIVIVAAMSGALTAAVRLAHSISMPHGRPVGGPYSSWLKKFPHRAIACMTNAPRATTSAHLQKLWCHRRRTTISAPGTGISYSVQHKRGEGSSEIANAIIGVIVLLAFLAFVAIGVVALFK